MLYPFCSVLTTACIDILACVIPVVIPSSEENGGSLTNAISGRKGFKEIGLPLG